jgi:L-lysine 2,3-aminomutase
VANRERYIANAHRRKQALALERASLLVEIFRQRPCVDCGESDPLVLEFDHLEEKSFNIAKGLRSHSWEAILDEIGKCEVVCANCHRRRTALRGGFARAAVAQR